jgi:hypothetical protein
VKVYIIENLIQYDCPVIVKVTATKEGANKWVDEAKRGNYREYDIRAWDVD